MGYRYNRSFEIDEEKAADFLEKAVERITTEEDIDTLVELYKLFKKNVPLSRRKYVVAYMLKNSLVHYRFFGHRGRDFERGADRGRVDLRQKPDFKESPKMQFSEGAPSEERPRHPRVEIPADQATTIFVSIGKNRRVFPRDLVGLLVAAAGVDRERIGDIKVLANYSFIQLYSEDAQGVIDKLNGYDYRGRKLVVSFSRQQSDSSEAPEDETADSEYTGDETQAMSDEDAAAYAAAEKAASDKTPFGV